LLPHGTLQLAHKFAEIFYRHSGFCHPIFERFKGFFRKEGAKNKEVADRVLIGQSFQRVI
jgi:hypothetical protein